MANKARLIRDTAGLSHFDWESTRQAVVDMSPLVWRIEVDALLVDVRKPRPEVQLIAYERGLIPYAPALDASDG